MTGPMLVNGMEQGPVFVSEDPAVLVAVFGDWSVGLQRSTEWGWLCFRPRWCRESRVGYRSAQAAAAGAEEHYRCHWKQAL